MNIAVIGAGRVGCALAMRLTEAGHHVAIANSRGPDTLRRVERQLGDYARAVTATQAAAFGDVVIVSVPFGRYAELPVAGTAGKPWSTPPTMSRAGMVTSPRSTTAASPPASCCNGICRRPTVVKAFNTMRWDHLRDYGRTGGSVTRYGMPVAGDDPGAKREVEDLVEQLGFAPVDAGDLARGGRRLQPGSSLFDADLTAEDLHARLDPEVLGAPGQRSSEVSSW